MARIWILSDVSRKTMAWEVGKQRAPRAMPGGRELLWIGHQTRYRLIQLR